MSCGQQTHKVVASSSNVARIMSREPAGLGSTGKRDEIETPADLRLAISRRCLAILRSA